MKRGRKPGQIVNQRDERGWMIPREGTVRRAVYEALVAGVDRAEACARLGLNRPALKTHIANIISSEKVREWRSAWMRDERDSAKAGAVG